MQSTTPPAASRRILLADDNRDSTAVMSLALEQHGYEVAVANNGEQAIKLARSFHPSTAILDLDMPGLDGFALARVLKRDDPALRLVAWSGAAQWSVEDRLGDAGFDGFLAKPAPLQAVLAALERRGANPPLSARLDEPTP